MPIKNGGAFGILSQRGLNSFVGMRRWPGLPSKSLSHQGGIAALPRDFDAAFNLIQIKKLQLTGQK
jgi:hypothetical protein